MSKRLLTYIILAAAAVTASCTKNTVDLPYGGAISFAPVAEKSTKAIIEGTTYPTTESFAVSAYHGGSDAYFEDLVASYNSSITLWETSTAEYWPLDGSLTFNAYSPSSASGVTITSAGVTATDYTIQTSAQMTTDLCYASATVADCADHPESVPLVFSHALSQVVFRVKAASYYANTTLTLNSLSIAGIYSVGDFTGSAWENQDTEYIYNLSSTPTNLTYDGENVPETIELSKYLLLPQTFGSNAAINVDYGVDLGGGRTFANPPVSIPLGSTIAAWEPGKKYIYTINIGIDTINFTATAAAWQEQEGGVTVE